MSPFQRLVATLTLAVLPGLVASAPSAICLPFFGVNTSDHSIVVSGNNSQILSAVVEGDSFGFVAVLDVSDAPAGTTGWNITSVNHGNSNAIYLSSLSTPVCMGGDGGPIDAQPCPTVVNATAPQLDQFFIFCAGCGSDGSYTSCQFQSANEGQCFSHPFDAHTLALEDCDNTDPLQFYDIIASV